ncbi:hypothetical protein SAV31267_006400 [Streptomyces avermitilis]|uniref:IS110 family transposase n=1 Tax=Streptomyces avermitilis TaxID=33903 RepID=A0A4D4MHH3_STRAX|nr:hypothetical protein SAV31267_006400 [Streptomyces avermitilis]
MVKSFALSERPFGWPDAGICWLGLSDASQTPGRRRTRRGGSDKLFIAGDHPGAAGVRACCERKADGKRHKEAMMRLARRRADVLFAMLRDGAPFEPHPTPPKPPEPQQTNRPAP